MVTDAAPNVLAAAVAIVPAGAVEAVGPNPTPKIVRMSPLRAGAKLEPVIKPGAPR